MKVHVIGAGLAGLAAALMLHDEGHQVTIVSRGIGGLGLSTGIIDVAARDWNGAPTTDPFAQVASAPAGHPYATIGTDAVRSGTQWLMDRVSWFDSVPAGNSLIPTSAGAVRPAYGLPKTMADSVLTDGMKLLVVGVSQFKDFPAELIADNLNRSTVVDVSARARTLDFTSRGIEHDSTATTFAMVLDGKTDAGGEPTSGSFPSVRAEQFASQIAKLVRPGEVVLVPAFLGFSQDVFTSIRAALVGAGAAGLAEVAVTPPSVPGRRIYDSLVAELHDRRIDLQLNAPAIGAEATGDRITHLNIQRAGRVTPVAVDAVVYAGGGFESGALARDSYGAITETVFGLPVVEGEDVLESGIAVSPSMQPLDLTGTPVYSNLYAAGTILAGGQPWSEKSGEGIALGSAWAASAALKGENS